MIDKSFGFLLVQKLKEEEYSEREKKPFNHEHEDKD